MGRFTVPPLPQESPIGSRVRFTCKVNSTPPTNITWLKDGQPLPQNTNRYAVLPTGTLQIYDITTEDAGAYRCVATNAANRKQSDEAQLTIKRQESSTFAMLTTPENQNKRVGEVAVLECGVATYDKSQGKPTVTWTKIGGSLERTRRLLDSLVIDNVQPEDSGYYNCTIASPQLPSVKQYKAFINVLKPPRLTLDDTDPIVETKVTQNRRIRCVTTGNPKPKITWLKDGKPLTINGRIREFQTSSKKAVSNGWRELLIGHITRADAGYYQCVARNSIGITLKTIKLSVQLDENRPLPPSNLRAIALSSDTVRLSWELQETYNGTKPLFTIHYYPTEGETKKEKQKLIRNSEKSSELIRDLQPYTNYSIYMNVYTSVRDQSFRPSDRSVTVVVLTKEGVPRAAPTVTLTSSNSSTIHVAWTRADPVTAQGRIVGYKVLYREHGTNSQKMRDVDGADNLEYTLTGLKANVIYDVRVATVTTAGFNRYLDESIWPWVSLNTQSTDTNNPQPSRIIPPVQDITPVYIVPNHGPPFDITWEIQSSGLLRLMWKPPKGPHSEILKYHVFYTYDADKPIDNWMITSIPGELNQAEFIDLQPGTGYTFKVRAIMSLGEISEPSESVLVTMPRCILNVCVPLTVEQRPLLSDRTIGIIIGVNIGGVCIIICAIIIACKNKCFPLAPQRCIHGYPANYIHHGNGNGHVMNGHIPNSGMTHSGTDLADVDCYTPVMPPLSQQLRQEAGLEGDTDRETSGDTQQDNPPVVNCHTRLLDDVQRSSRVPVDDLNDIDNDDPDDLNDVDPPIEMTTTSIVPPYTSNIDMDQNYLDDRFKSGQHCLGTFSAVPGTGQTDPTLTKLPGRTDPTLTSLPAQREHTQTMFNQGEDSNSVSLESLNMSFRPENGLSTSVV
ncbi:unnamed protein product [Owenia fusiformis]|uniref:Cell adhesion molecule-related/down-regulated by oncogenes n=1 Tax=Owenia fusiformis TaxID=6347 RepID=A0A8J1Y5L2_OWEFU|nr:unnamed protein product [Owenia fusiformis]